MIKYFPKFLAVGLIIVSIAISVQASGFSDDTLVLKALSALNLSPSNFAISPDIETPDPFRSPIITYLLLHSDQLESVSMKLTDSVSKQLKMSPSITSTLPVTWDKIVTDAKLIRERNWTGFTPEERIKALSDVPDLYREDDNVADLDVFTLKERQEIGADSMKATNALIKKIHGYTDWNRSLNALRAFTASISDTSNWEMIFGSLRHTPLAGVTGAIVGWQETSGGIVIIGSKARNIYDGEFAAIIDLGGNDEYRGRFAGNSEKVPVGLVIDFEGDDYYLADSNFSCAGARDGIAMLLDFSGNDHYIGNQWSQGAAMMGASLLEDRSGFDSYEADANSQGCAAFGSASLHDFTGNDNYRIHMYGQGVGLIAGWGTLLDEQGDDQYLATPRYVDVLRYQDHSLTLSQGFGYGLRPNFSGGFGFLIDETGSDFYMSDIYGQGCSYWYALGVLLDKTGNDRYLAYQYAQGSGIHISLGLLRDEAGDDHYDSKGVSQGCGHDLGTGYLHDLAGEDSYICSDLSQGAGSANGFGVLIDDAGNDVYSNRNSVSTMGYGNPRRDYGSIGLFLDKAGDDRYADTDAADGRMWLRGIRGVGWDIAKPALKGEKP